MSFNAEKGLGSEDKLDEFIWSLDRLCKWDLAAIQECDGSLSDDTAERRPATVRKADDNESKDAEPSQKKGGLPEAGL